MQKFCGTFNKGGSGNQLAICMKYCVCDSYINLLTWHVHTFSILFYGPALSYETTNSQVTKYRHSRM